VIINLALKRINYIQPELS